ncbi:halocyanin domain-containing protein [halophilic archaeon]|nr:halocyanin domain-containing protein [halophilic archaeon]
MRSDRRTYLKSLGIAATSTSLLAGCLGGQTDGDGGDGGGTTTDGGEGATTTDGGDQSSSSFGGWFDGVSNFDGVTDETGSKKVTVKVGAKGNNGNNAFSPAAVKVSKGTTVVWKWTGKGSMHNVVAKNGDFESDMMSEKGATFERTFDGAGTYKYYCNPHKAMGMKGAIVVE